MLRSGGNAKINDGDEQEDGNRENGNISSKMGKEPGMGKDT